MASFLVSLAYGSWDFLVFLFLRLFATFLLIAKQGGYVLQN